jgi:hypothetical protein
MELRRRTDCTEPPLIEATSADCCTYTCTLVVVVSPVEVSITVTDMM